ncbi:hypothetical protein X743_28555 [Mesorhizobium sp. LNHC252B00]|nr:hypothetical protein X743_28555 [Mesorhizobium sp. LNHC252B00]
MPNTYVPAAREAMPAAIGRFSRRTILAGIGAASIAAVT